MLKKLLNNTAARISQKGGTYPSTIIEKGDHDLFFKSRLMNNKIYEQIQSAVGFNPHFGDFVTVVFPDGNKQVPYAICGSVKHAPTDGTNDFIEVIEKSDI